MKRVFRVIMEIPENATALDVASYIHDAVSSMGGALQPPGFMIDDPSYHDETGDPMFGSHHCRVEFVSKGITYYIEEGMMDL